MVAARSEALARLLPADLRELLRTRTLMLQRPVWGRRQGRHRSARAGVGLDFRDHRPYVPGDEIRHLDWRAVARRDRLVLRQTEAEDELPVSIIIDGSGGMGYGSGRTRKIDAARSIAGALAWLASAQGDTVGLSVGLEGRAEAELARPASGHERMVAVTKLLLDLQPSGVCPWPEVLAAVVPRLPRRSLVVVLSDLLDPGGQGRSEDDEALLRGLSQLRARQHDVVVVQLLHADETGFPWEQRRMMRFVDLHGQREPIEAAASNLRDDYLQRMREHLQWLDRRCEAEGLFLERWQTDAPLADAFVSMLARLSGVAGAASDSARVTGREGVTR